MLITRSYFAQDGVPLYRYGLVSSIPRVCVDVALTHIIVFYKCGMTVIKG